MQIRKESIFLVLPAVLAIGLQSWIWPYYPEETGTPPPNTAGIIVDDSYTIEDLVQDIFVKGGCKNISNIKSIGRMESGIGYFENGRTSVGIEKGIIFSTGDINSAPGPNDETETSTDFRRNAGDQDLAQLSTARVADVMGFEFDFVPLDSIVTFRYVFASEEYCEYVGTKFNDVFGFFISGPGISGPFSNNGVNVALIPGTNDYVSINSVNHFQNTEYYVDNVTPDDARDCGIPHIPTNKQSEVEYDGFTTVLTATLNLIPCETYHLRLVVGDVSDRQYDSAVFLEAESFNIGGAATVSSESSIEPGVVFEGCPNGEFVFNRVNTEDLSMPLEIDFLLSDAGTAVEGVDFEPLPRSVVIPAGELSVTLPVNIINDQIREDRESILLELDYPCDCVTGDASMIVADPPEFLVNIPSTAVCPGGEARLAPEIMDGAAPFTFEWSTGDTDSVLTVTPEEPSRYIVTITDACGQQVVQGGQVEILAPPQAEISGIDQVCPGEEGVLSVRFTGTAPWQITYSIDGLESETISGIEENPYLLDVDQEGTYELIRFSDSRCSGTTSGSGTLEISRPEIKAEVSGVSCANLSDGQVNIEVEGGSLPYRYFWDQDIGERKSLQNVAAGAYSLTVTDALGCETTKQVTVPSPQSLQEIAFDCLDLGTDSIDFRVEGGTPPYRFSTDGSNFFDETLFQRLDAGRFYTLIIRDAKGCRLEQDFIMPSNTNKYVELTREITAILGQRFQLSPQLLIPSSLVRDIQWTPPTDLSCVDCLEPALDPQVNRSYTIRVTDLFGCWDEESIIVNVNRRPSVFIPSAFSPNNDGSNDKLIIFADPDQVSRIKLFQVYNRWGNLMHEVRDVQPNNPAFGWDGRFRGQWQKPGVYLYVAEIELVNGNTLFKNGDVALIR